jgi:hypothetical protein
LDIRGNIFIDEKGMTNLLNQKSKIDSRNAIDKSTYLPSSKLHLLHIIQIECPNFHSLITKEQLMDPYNVVLNFSRSAA